MNYVIHFAVGSYVELYFWFSCTLDFRLTQKSNESTKPSKNISSKVCIFQEISFSY